MSLGVFKFIAISMTHPNDYTPFILLIKKSKLRKPFSYMKVVSLSTFSFATSTFEHLDSSSRYMWKSNGVFHLHNVMAYIVSYIKTLYFKL